MQRRSEPLTPTSRRSPWIQRCGSVSKMILKCGKTGRLFFTTEEAQEHAEAFGAAYANFEEVSMDTKVGVRRDWAPCLHRGRDAADKAARSVLQDIRGEN